MAQLAAILWGRICAWQKSYGSSIVATFGAQTPIFILVIASVNYCNMSIEAGLNSCYMTNLLTWFRQNSDLLKSQRAKSQELDRNELAFYGICASDFDFTISIWLWQSGHCDAQIVFVTQQLSLILGNYFKAYANFHWNNVDVRR